jgi:rSAM/selenodomain-associated transferase 2
VTDALDERRPLWPRLLAVAVTLLLLVAVFRALDLAGLKAAFARLRPGAFAAAAAVYVLALWWSGLRWHAALRATDCAVHVGASVRLMWIGHFFFTALFGAVGGDFAKSAVYARWFRFGLPEVLAAAPLDRALSAVAALLLGLGTLLLAWAGGGLKEMEQFQWNVAPGWTVAGAVLLAAGGMALWRWRPAGAGGVARAVRAFRSGSGGLLNNPRAGLTGLGLAFAGHLALSGVLALCLAAVSGTPLPWLNLAWTFPVITTISCLPFTVAGAGAREVAAVTLLGLYGVPAADAVAAAWLALSLKLALAVVGASLWWSESRWRGRHLRADASENVPTRSPSQPAPMFSTCEQPESTLHASRLTPYPAAVTISVVIPALNEAATLPETVRRARANPEVAEIIVVDGGSRDGTPDVAAALGCRVLSHPASRGGQLRAGAARAAGDVVLLLHADTWLPPDAGRAALNCLRDERVVAGGCWKRFDAAPWFMHGSRLRCILRLWLGGRVLGDQAMFVRRSVLERIGGVPDVPLMEDWELCRRLRREGRLALAAATVVTSARRFHQLGVVRTYWRMALVTWRHRLGAPASELKKLYERE